MTALGPRDRRTLRTRCVACTRRKIKCEGGSPCLYCIKKKQDCVPQAVGTKTDVIFVNTSVSSKEGGSISVTTPLPKLQLCSNVPQDDAGFFIKHFFSAFLATNNFGGPLDLDTIVTQFQTSSSLYHASIAVGALDLSKKCLLPTPAERRSAAVGALTAYRTSIITFQKEIQSKNARQNDANLWTTLFMGLFELMYDVTGEGWVKHILYGTSTILQLRGPEAHLTGPGRSFFLTVRVFEICRSLIYSEPTFLCEPSWRSLMTRIWDGNLNKCWHPKETLLDLMITCSTLSHRVWDAVKPNSNHSAIALTLERQRLAAEGLIIRAALDNWYISFQSWSEVTHTPAENPQSILATAYYHATSIYLSGIFDYRCEFAHIPSPMLCQSRIQNHVTEILSTTKRALDITNLAGVLFFFPLRVAGARATCKEETMAILEMLCEISTRSFVVADAFKEDLRGLWQQKDI